MPVKSKVAFHSLLKRMMNRLSLLAGIFLALAPTYPYQTSKRVFMSVSSPPTSLNSRYKEQSPENDYTLSGSISLIGQSAVKSLKPMVIIPFRNSCL
jgi:hypothetical protein